MDNNIKNPIISVVLPIYNGEKYLGEAIQSILNQTFTDFELLIIDDCSKDNGLEIAQSYKDPRIRILKNEKNLGLALSIDRGIQESRGQFIARMDQDDIALRQRFARQILYLENHRDIDIVGTWATTIGEKTGVKIRRPTNPDEVKASLLFRTSLIHPTIMIRKSFLEKNGVRYGHFENNTVGFIEDYDFYTRAIQFGKLANISEVLLKYRKHSAQTSVEKVKTQIEFAKVIVRRQLERLGIDPTEEDLATAVAVKRYLFLDDMTFQHKLEKLFRKIIEANEIKKIYKEKSLKKVFGEIWLDVALAYRAHNKDAWIPFWNYPVKWIRPSFSNIVRIIKLWTYHIVS